MRKSPELPNELCAQLGEAETFASAVKRLWWENKLAAASAIVILLFILTAAIWSIWIGKRWAHCAIPVPAATSSTTATRPSGKSLLWAARH